MTIHTHLQKHPHARASTLAQLQKEEAMTNRLREEISAAKQVNEYRQKIGYVGWFRRLIRRR